MNPVDTGRHAIKETLTLPFLAQFEKKKKNILTPSRKKPLSNCLYRTPLLASVISKKEKVN